MAEHPLVSVVLPVRDGGRFLVEAVDSILQQSHPNLELILVDDHSVDGAVQALDGSDHRLKRVASQGEGVVNAFNTGLALAGGDFVARMDADDIALPQRLEHQVALLSREPDLDIAGAKVEIFSATGLAAGNQHYQDWLNNLSAPEAIRRELFVESPIPNPTAMFRRSAIQVLGGYRDTEWPEDYDLFLRADRLGMKMAKPDNILLRWRDHDGRLTRTDDRYTRARFQAAKAHYLVQGRLPERSGLLIWGAGDSGREFHDLLVAEGASISGFVEVHPRRIGGQKRGLPVYPIEKAAQWREGMVLVAVGARGARLEIREFLDGAGRQEGADYLFVC